MRSASAHLTAEVATSLGVRAPQRARLPPTNVSCRLSPIRFRPSIGAVQRARQYLGGRRNRLIRRSSASMDGASSIGDDSVRREGSASE